MSIRSLFKLALSIALTIAIILATASWLTQNKISKLFDTEQQIQAASMYVSDLLILSHEYFLYDEPRAAQQWLITQSYLVSTLNQGVVAEVSVPASALQHAITLPIIFRKLKVANYENTELIKRQKSLLMDQLLNKTQVVADQVHHWSKNLTEERSKIVSYFYYMAILIPILMLVILGLLTSLLFRRVLTPLSVLHKAVVAISKGDLSIRCATDTNDEFGELSRTFDAMAVELVSELRQEIAEHKKTEETLTTANIIINRSSVVAFKWKGKPGWPVQSVSENVVNLLGYKAEEFLNETITYSECIHSDDIKTVEAEVISSIINGNSTSFSHEPYRVITKAGEIKWVDDTTYPCRNFQGKITHMEGLVNDITKRINAKEQQLELERQLRQSHKMQAIGIMTGGVAHNFNNSLAVILGNVELAQSKLSSDSDIIKNLNNAKIAIQRSRDVVNQLMTYSNYGTFDKTKIQLSKTIDDTLNFLTSTIPSTVKVKQLIAPENTNIHINADISQFQEALVNLCNNAVFAMEEKGLLTISLETVDIQKQDLLYGYDRPLGQYAKISVIDNGCGMNKKDLDNIFDPFFTTKEIHDGTGLGLSTVRGTVDNHDGMIHVKSELGKGSTFELFFPTVDAPLTVIPVQQNDEEIATGNERILFVDDEVMLANLGEVILSELGYQVTSVTSSIEALQIFQDAPNQFDLVISDQSMPGLSGKELITKLLKIRADLPTILITGYSNKIDKEESKKLGIKAFCMKPMDIELLAKMVRKVLEEV